MGIRAYSRWSYGVLGLVLPECSMVLGVVLGDFCVGGGFIETRWSTAKIWESLRIYWLKSCTVSDP